MAKIEKFEDIIVWQRSRELIKEIYLISSKGKFEKDFSLRDQLRRAAVSISLNVVEGFERGGDREFSQFLYIAKGSAGEVRALFYTALDLQYISEEEFKKLFEKVNEISQLLSGLIKYLKQSEFKGIKYKS